MSRSLPAWLERIERLHPQSIEMGLDRVAAVRDRLQLRPQCPVVLVGGTNGKGSTSAMLESIYRSAGYRTGLYTSPHLLEYNERVVVDGQPAADSALVEAFEYVDEARAEISLTYFEFGTLAAQLVFVARGVDVAILEVGLGGRLDAVNVFEPAVSVITSVGVDHVEYLGPDRESIGREKAGIFRGDGTPGICGDEDPPAALLDYAREIGADLYLMGRDFGYVDHGGSWQFWNSAGRKAGLPLPALRGSWQLGNAATALECVHRLHPRLPVDMGAVRNGLLNVRLPGRLQVLPGRPMVILDVAHNAQAVAALAGELQSMPDGARTLAVFAVLADKDFSEMASGIAEQIDRWFVCGLSTPRGAMPQQVAAAVGAHVHGRPVEVLESVAEGLSAARAAAAEGDRILVFGSFYTVSEALKTSEALLSPGTS